MTHWFTVLTSANSLVGVAAAILFALAFWRLMLLAPSVATRLGLGGALAHLGLWLFFGTIWALSMVPGIAADWVFRVYEIPFLTDGLWIVGLAGFALSVLCVAWILHRGIEPKAPDSPEADAIPR